MKKEGQIARSLKSKLIWLSQVVRKKEEEVETVDSERSQNYVCGQPRRQSIGRKMKRRTSQILSTTTKEEGDLGWSIIGTLREVSLFIQVEEGERHGIGALSGSK